MCLAHHEERPEHLVTCETVSETCYLDVIPNLETRDMRCVFELNEVERGQQQTCGPRSHSRDIGVLIGEMINVAFIPLLHLIMSCISKQRRYIQVTMHSYISPRHLTKHLLPYLV
jgi:hypothetical protein